MCLFYILFCTSTSVGSCGFGKNHIDVQYLFSIIASLVNVVGASAKRRDILRDKQVMLVIKAFRNSEFQVDKT